MQEKRFPARTLMGLSSIYWNIIYLTTGYREIALAGISLP